MKVATLHLSGTRMKIGFIPESNPAEDAIWFQTDDQTEPTYISRQEAKLLICALKTAIEEPT